MKKVIILVIMSIFLSSHLALASEDRILYVDCNMINDGTGTKSDPFKTIGQACEIVNPGDTVLINPGVYYEFVELNRAGTKEKPIVFRALNSALNETIITGAHKEIRENTRQWKLYDGAEDNLTDIAAGKNVYSVDMEYEPSRVLYDGVDLLPFLSLEGLLTNIIYPTPGELYMEGTEHGWVYKNGKLFVRLHPSGKYGSINPNEHIMAASPSTYYDADGTKVEIDGALRKGIKGNIIGEKSANFWIDIKPNNEPQIVVDNPLASGGTFSQSSDLIVGASAHVVIDGLTFETPGYAGVYARASDIVVRNSWFRGVRSAVFGGSRWFDDRITSDNITIEYCDYTQFPTFEDVTDIIEKSHNDPKITANRFFWWQRKGSFTNTHIKDKFDYESSSFVSKIGRNWVIRNNNLFSCFDAMGYGSALSRTEIRESGKQFEVGCDGVEIYNNRFERIVDNAIEFENRGMNYNIYNNEFIDSFWPISWQPLNGRPFPTNIIMRNNLLYTSEEIGKVFLEKGKYQAGFIKIGAEKAQWLSFPWMKDQPWDYVNSVPLDKIRPDEEGFKFYNNTVVMPKGYFLEKVNGDPNMYFDNFEFKNNIFVTYLKQENDAVAGALKPGQSLLDNTELDFAKNIFSPSYKTNKIRPLDAVNNGGVLLNDPLDVGFKDISNNEFELKEDSVARGKGEVNINMPYSNADLGAIPYGEIWSIGMIGPRVMGDMNFDGKCDILDLLKASRLVGAEVSHSNFICDMNSDGKIDHTDLEMIAYLVK